MASTSAAGLSNGQVNDLQMSGDFAIKSESVTPKLGRFHLVTVTQVRGIVTDLIDTSQWPLLLKNYDKLLVRSSHFTPIPTGVSPLKRDLQAYVK